MDFAQYWFVFGIGGRNKMTECELLEYAIYHWIFGGDSKLPGLNNRGFIDSNFFKDYPAKTSYQAFSEQFSLIRDDPCLTDNNALMLCSGGVDSSLLAYFRYQNLKECPQNLIHTSYVNHNNNDLQKFINVLGVCPSNSYVSSINAAGYISGIDFLSRHKFYQNTYAPTLAFAFSSIEVNSFTCLITGSGPDELFYGMEKYSWDTFEKLSDTPTAIALEKLDPSYNFQSYFKLLNTEGREILEKVKRKRRRLYENIADLQMNIFDSQRILAYATVTAQHMQLFNKIAKLFNFEHNAPYLNDQLVRLALTTPLDELVELGGDKQVEIGKKYLKRYLSQYMSEDHVYGKKIGFHAPTSKFVFEYSKRFLLEHIEYLPSWLNRDKTINEINMRFDVYNQSSDYFLYSLVNIIKHQIGKSNDC
jgi:asparagine synthetase B (glutamine-hydrolysing)